ncbi:spore germination protein [Effusibacillus pohliae]|uniref:spore germination protein n=1 Tax=Effusibacillus pohliae TaxID=232270 RepID=UPI00038066B3|nr:spore germination protein [Effusibacillus pohliae]
MIRKRINRKKEVLANHFEQTTLVYRGQTFSGVFDQDLKQIQDELGNSDDVIFHEFKIDHEKSRKAAIVYIDGLVDTEMVNNFILRPLINQPLPGGERIDGTDVVNYLPMSEVRKLDDMEKAVKAVLSGDTVLLMDGASHPLSISTKGWKQRSVEEPDTESVIRGPRDGFTETLRVNTALVRRRLKDPKLRVQNLKIGERTETDVALLYIDGIANDAIVHEVKARIDRIEMDAVLESGFIEQFIEDNHWSPFPQIQNTERPDKVAASLLEGRIAVLVDGSPFALIAPATFSQFYNSPEDYYERFLIATLIRMIRVLSMFMALLLPSLYIAFSSFHPEMIPSKLVIAMAAGRATVPFSSVLEALLMEITMEILREASVRLPGPIGPTIGIVGALVVGESAVRAGIVSPIMVIVVALTTIGSFATPSYSAAISLRMLRFPMMLFAGTLGLYGIMLFLIVIIIHLCTLESFGIPYLSPMAPRIFTEWKDTILRAPLYRMLRRPASSLPADEQRVVPASAETIRKGERHDKADSSDHN